MSSLLVQSDLAHLVAREASSRVGARIIHIKGPIARSHGIATRSHSADADVIIGASSFADFADSLGELGWAPRAMSALSARMANHAVTFCHPDWPADIDAHTRFPGLLVESAELMEVLARRELQLLIAGCPISGVDYSASLLIHIAHALRRLDQSGGPGKETVEQLRARVSLLSETQQSDLILAARELCADETLASVLCVAPAFAIEPKKPLALQPGLVRWQLMLNNRSNLLSRAVVAISEAPREMRFSLVSQLIWPTRAQLAIDHPGGGTALQKPVRYRLGRLVRGAKMVLKALVGKPDLARRNAGGSLSPDKN